MDIKVEEKDGLYCVRVRIAPFSTKLKRRTIVHTGAVKRALSEAGYEFGEVVEETRINNANDVTEGTWVFKKKVLDKRPKQVILKEEKEVKPKPARKKRTRSSTKKVSTED
tara:strand:+ start:1162 stop:1494 length:333 start_codon:yes stop_codon:yes gene_type:complete